MNAWRGVGWGAAAGAAGTTALNAVTYLDMAARARGSSDTPQLTVDKLAAEVGVPIPGEGESRENRLSGLGALLGIAAGVGTGVLLGLARSAGWRPAGLPAVGLATGVALLAGNAPMTVLGVTDPREWSPSDWISDVVPHLAYGVVAAAVLQLAEKDR